MKMSQDTIAFLTAQKASANNPVGSHVARSRGAAIRLARDNQPVALKVASEIDADLEAASNVSEMHPDSCHRLAVWLREWRRAL